MYRIVIIIRLTIIIIIIIIAEYHARLTPAAEMRVMCDGIVKSPYD